MNDKNGDNELSTAELLYALRKQGSVRALLGLEAVKFSDSPSKAAFDAAFAKMDADTSSMISPKELDAFLKSALAQEGPPALELSLNSFADAHATSLEVTVFTIGSRVPVSVPLNVSRVATLTINGFSYSRCSYCEDVPSHHAHHGTKGSVLPGRQLRDVRAL